MFEDHDGIGIGDCGKQHALGIMRRGRLDHLQARHMGEPRLQALAMLGGSARAGARRKAHDQWDRHLATQHEAHLCRLVDDLLHGKRREIGELEFENRPHAGHGGAHGNAGAAQLGNRHVDDAIGSETLDEVARHLEGAAIDADVLAHQEDARIALQRDGHRLLDCLGIAELSHCRVHHIFSV